jgi:hypothetical protein
MTVWAKDDNITYDISLGRVNSVPIAECLIPTAVFARDIFYLLLLRIVRTIWITMMRFADVSISNFALVMPLVSS